MLRHINVNNLYVNTFLYLCSRKSNLDGGQRKLNTYNMKQTKLNAIMKAQVIFTTCATAGYLTTMSAGSNKKVEVTIFYNDIEDWNIIKRILLLNKNKEDKIEGKNKEDYKWITYTTYYE